MCRPRWKQRTQQDGMHNLEDHLLALQGMENPLCYFSTKESGKERLLREENARGPKQVGGEGQGAVVTVPAHTA